MINYIEKVHKLYWEEDVNCATAIIRILAERVELSLDQQVIDGLIGIPGASKHGSLCGLVSGGLVFIGIYGKGQGLAEQQLNELCYDYSEEFIARFSSTECHILRPEGFREDNPPHLCEALTNDAVEFAVDFIERRMINKV